MATRGTLSAGRLALGAALVVAIAAAIALWNWGRVGEAPPRARTIDPSGTPRTAADATRPAALPAPAAPAAQAPPPTQVTAAPTTPDPFKSFLEAHRGSALPAASQAAPAAPIDPFKAALEAARRGEPVPLVSPFGTKQ